MFITRLEARNFRSIEGLDLELGRLNVLIGPNGAGKSNILLAIDELVRLAHPGALMQIKGGRRQDDRTGLALEFKMPQAGETLRWEVTARYDDRGRLTDVDSQREVTGEDRRSSLRELMKVRRLTDRTGREMTRSAGDLERAGSITGMHMGRYPSLPGMRTARIMGMVRQGGSIVVGSPDAGLHPTSAAALAGVLGDPGALVWVENTPEGTGTRAVRGRCPESVTRDLEKSGTGLGQYLLGRGPRDLSRDRPEQPGAEQGPMGQEEE